jgi:hypothetical protein
MAPSGPKMTSTGNGEMEAPDRKRAYVPAPSPPTGNVTPVPHQGAR